MKRVTLEQAAAAIGQIEAKVQLMAQSVPRRAVELVAPELLVLVRRGFDTGSDPFGRPWAKLRPATLATGRTPPPLTATGAMAASAQVERISGGLRLTIARRYAKFHQVGFRVGRTKVAPRRMLPAYGVPETWRKALRAAALRAFNEAKGGR